MKTEDGDSKGRKISDSAKGAEGSVSRRGLAGHAVGAIAVVALGGTVLSSKSWGQSTFSAGPATSASAPSMQPGWRWCEKCQGMFYAVATQNTFGHCPAGGVHTDSGSAQYSQALGDTTSPRRQSGWRWCGKCQGFFYSKASFNTMGVCPAGGAHSDTGSGHYEAVVGETLTGQQGGWRWCEKCQGMFYANASANRFGKCPAGSTHTDNGSGHYACLT